MLPAMVFHMFFIETEIQARELERGLLLGMLAAREGHDVFLTPEPIKALRAARSSGHVLHMNSLTSTRLDAYEAMSKRGNFITSQDEENFLAGSRSGTTIQYENRASNRAAQLVERVHSWGPIDHEIIVRAAPELGRILLPTGGARTDFWRGDLDDYFWPRRSWLPDGQYVLVASPFGRVLMPRRPWQDFTSRRQRGYSNPIADAHWFRRIGEAWGALGHLVAAVRAMAERHPHARFVLRPHPIESDAAWPAFLAGLPNVEVRREGAVGHWVKHATAVVTMGDTVTYEAVAMGIPTINFLPDSYGSDGLPSEFGTRATTVAEVTDLVSSAIAGDLVGDKEAVALDSIFWPADRGRLASEKMVSHWIEVGEKPLTGSARNRALRSIYGTARWRYARKWRKRARSRTQSNPKFPPLARETVVEALSGLNRVVENGGVDFRLVTPTMVHVFPSTRPRSM